MAIDGILLPLAVSYEFHGKCFLCVSDYLGGHQGMGRGRYAPAVLSLHRFAAVPPVHEPRAATPSATHILMPTVEIHESFCLVFFPFLKTGVFGADMICKLVGIKD